MRFGLKLGSKNVNYTEDVLSFYDAGYFQYMELFAVPKSVDDTIGYWRQFSMPIVIHAPHSFAGMNLSLPGERKNNEKALRDVFRFADALKSERVIFHPGVNGDIDETVRQLRPFADPRCVIENKPAKGLNGEKCLGAALEELEYIINELQCGFCLDFGHAICAANSAGRNPLEFIKELSRLNPAIYHLTDGDFASEHDAHLRYGRGDFPIKELLEMVGDDDMVTNEAKHESESSLNDFKEDYFYVKSI